MSKITEGTLALFGMQSGHSRRNAPVVTDTTLISGKYPISNRNILRSASCSLVILRIGTDSTINLLTARSQVNFNSVSYSGVTIRI
jgi:hypothetical protein